MRQRQQQRTNHSRIHRRLDAHLREGPFEVWKLKTLLRFEPEVTSNFDSYLELYNSDGDWIDYSDDYSDLDLDARLVYTATSTGSYYFEVHAWEYNSSENGPYSISVTTSSQRIASSIEVRSPRSDHLLKQEIKTRKANLKRWFQL